MYKNELDNAIQSAKVSNNFVFFGESTFLIDMYTTMMSNIDDSCLLSMYHDEYHFKTAKDHLNQSSLFGDRNVLVVKSDKKVPKKDLSILIELCEKNPDNVFIYAYYGTDHKTYNNKKYFGKSSTMSVRFFNPKDYESQNIVLQVAKEKGVNIDKYSVSHLLNIHNGDVALACNEMDKFRVYDKDVTTKDIENLVFGLAEVSIDELIKNLLNKKDFKHDLQNLLDHGEDEIRIITAITSYITQLYMFNIYIRVNGAPNALEILGYPAPKFVIDEKSALSLRFKLATYYKLQEILLESELKMKSFGTQKCAILLSALIRVQKLL